MDHSNRSVTRQRENSPWLARFSETFRSGSLTLDLGCGAGDDSAELAAMRCHVISVDLAPERIRLVPAGVSAPVVADLAGWLPFRGEVFDAVVASLSLHYFDARTTDRAVKEIARVIRPGGYLIFRVNAVGDVNFGYGNGVEIEPSVFRQPDGRLKRFFDPGMVRRFVEPCFTLQRVEPRTILQHHLEKRTLECLARKQ